MKILNAFSANMLPALPISVTFTEVTASYVARRLGCIRADGETLDSCVGHADTARIFSSELSRYQPDIEIPANRVSVKLAPGEQAFIGQYSGPRLPEGATTLPSGATIRWIVAEVSMD